MIITYHAWFARFMDAADLFDKGKYMGEVRILTVTYNEGVELTIEKAGSDILKIKEGMEKYNIFVSFIHLLNIRTGDMVTVNNQVGHYAPPEGIRAISTGTHQYMLDDFLRSRGMTVETDEYRFIRKITQ